MKRSWVTYLLVAGLLTLLVMIGVLQYYALTQINRGEGEKAHSRVKEQADRFAADFNREIQSAYFNFQTDAESWKSKDWTAFNERYDYWREKTTYPHLINDFYFVEAKSEIPPIKYDRESRSFVSVAIPPELETLRKHFMSEADFFPVYDDVYTLVLPIHTQDRKIRKIIGEKISLVQVASSPRAPISKESLMPEKYGYLVIKLDPVVIKEEILPDLAAKYFGGGEFRAAVTDKAGQAVYQTLAGETSDASVPLFDLSPDNFIFFENRDLTNSVSGQRESGTVMTREVESQTLNRVEMRDAKEGTLKIEVKRGGQPRRSVFTASTTNGDAPKALWTLQVQHAYGSIDAFMAWTLRRNLAIGFGLLFLLAAAISAIIISAQRAKMLAEHQVSFVSSVSHEFRTPLAVIYSAAENLADGVTKEQVKISQYGELIKVEGKKLSGMVEQILDFAGANSGRKQYNFVEINVGDVVQDALSECGSLLKDKEIEVITHFSDAIQPIQADPVALSGAIQNLIVNSVKYGNGANWLRISAENGSGKTKISVEDRGIGISKSELKQIFEPFYRSQSVVDAQIHGNGLGLALVKQIVKAHGGHVTATSEVGKGSNFTIEIQSRK